MEYKGLISKNHAIRSKKGSSKIEEPANYKLM